MSATEERLMEIEKKLEAISSLVKIGSDIAMANMATTVQAFEIHLSPLYKNKEEIKGLSKELLNYHQKLIEMYENEE